MSIDHPQILSFCLMGGISCILKGFGGKAAEDNVWRAPLQGASASCTSVHDLATISISHLLLLTTQSYRLSSNCKLFEGALVVRAARLALKISLAHCSYQQTPSGQNTPIGTKAVKSYLNMRIKCTTSERYMVLQAVCYLSSCLAYPPI